MEASSSAWAELPAEVAHTVFELLLQRRAEFEDDVGDDRRPSVSTNGVKRKRHSTVTASSGDEHAGLSTTLAVIDGLSVWGREASSAEEQQRDGLCWMCWGDESSGEHNNNWSVTSATVAAARLTSRSFAAAVDAALPSLVLGLAVEGSSTYRAGDPSKFTGVQTVTLGTGYLDSPRVEASSDDNLNSAPAGDACDADRSCGRGVSGRLAVVAKLPNLTSLDVRRCSLTAAEQLNQLASLTGLHRLALGHVCSINCSIDRIPPCADEPDSRGDRLKVVNTIASLSRLTALDLSECDVIGDITVAELVAAAPALSCLNLANCWHLSWAGIESLASLSATLTCLDLSGSRTPAIRPLASLAKLTRLTRLNLRSCIRLTSVDLYDLAPLASNLTSLDLSYCSKIGHDGLTGSALGAFTSLSSISLMGTSIGDQDVAAMGASPLSRCLKSLLLALCCRITDAGLELGVARLVSLRSLSLAFCSGITNAGVVSLLPLKDSLTQLDLAGCYKITGVIKRGSSIFGALRMLQRVDLSQTGATDEAVANIARHPNRLEQLRLVSCSRVTCVGQHALNQVPYLRVEV